MHWCDLGDAHHRYHRTRDRNQSCSQLHRRYFRSRDSSELDPEVHDFDHLDRDGLDRYFDLEGGKTNYK